MQYNTEDKEMVMIVVDKLKSNIEESIVPQLQVHFESFILQGECFFYGVGDVDIHLGHKADSYKLCDLYPGSPILQEFQEDLLAGGVSRKNWCGRSSSCDRSTLPFMRKIDPVLKEYMDSYALLGFSKKGGYILLKAGCDGFNAIQLLARGYATHHKNKTIQTCSN
jgi:hypothetical protein